ncbi:MAG: HEAT repeat domain-containing protein, partial [Gemmatimonadaceae bacterium]|nr:HEAT repeat domain-containing protein [Gemmatimonadaceae bacterium]
SSRLWWRRLEAARLLTLIGTAREAMLRLSRDAHPLVRAQAAEWMSQHPDPEIVDRLVDQVADPAAVVRFAARDALMRIGAPAQDAIAHALSVAPTRAQAELIAVAAAMPSSIFLARASELSASDDAGVRCASAALLRAVGGASAADRLIVLLDDPDERVRRVAAESLGQLAHWPAATAVAARLEDPSWSVRLGAAVALQRLGAPGVMLLQRARDRTCGDAGDVARQVLEVAEHLLLEPPR